MANSENQKAKIVITKAAKVNNVILSTALLSTFDESPDQDVDTKNYPENVVQKEKIMPIVKDMFKSNEMKLRFSIVYFIWYFQLLFILFFLLKGYFRAVNAFVYYGLSINSTTLSGNKYINFALVSLIEIPGYSLAWICIQKLGRKPSLVLSLLLCGVTCTLTIFASKGT